MTPYHSDPWLTVYQGDCREVMAQMEPESVHCVVTSPPYWGLRDYGTATWIGGDEGCDHAFVPDPGVTSQREGRTYQQGHAHRNCRCGAVRQDSQLGLEPTPELYVENMVAVFREVRRVLRKDGTCWVNLGDSYAGSGPSGAAYQSETTLRRAAGDGTDGAFRVSKRLAERGLTYAEKKPIPPPGLKPKDLVGIPWRVAFALQADGWYLRSDIIWSKPNPMPESVVDRPTKSHEYVFLLSKSPRYYFDADAVRERGTDYTAKTISHGGDVGGGVNDGRTRIVGNVATPALGRNLRTVWTIATQPYPGAHFATFPEALVEPCVKAGTSERGVCPECGAPWTREVERGEASREGPTGSGWREAGARGEPTTVSRVGERSSLTTGWRPSCSHTAPEPSDRVASAVTVLEDVPTAAYRVPVQAAPIPATVLDPFAGSGTTGRVAQRLGRRAVLIDLSGEYLTQTMKRNADIPLGLETA